MESAAESIFIADGGAEIEGEIAATGAAVGAGDAEAAGFAADVAETGFSAPSAGGGAIETLASEVPETGAGATLE